MVRRLEIELLYTDYAHCLDNDRLEDWPGFFTEDCAYRVISAENFEAGLPLGLIYATSKNMLVDRVMALREANIYEPQRYRHMTSNIRIKVHTTDLLDVVANFIVVRTMQDGAVGGFVQRAIVGSEDECSIIEMGGGEHASQETRTTEASIRGFWQAYRPLMGL